MIDNQDCTSVLVDVGVLKTQVATISLLCEKMDKLIEKLIDKQDKITEEVYDDMERKRQETVSDIKELHSRITTVDRNLSDKIELTERRIMDEIKSLRDVMNEHNKKEDSELKKILEWKWMAAGGIIVLAWIISNVNVDMIGKLFG
jgi:hypothetical protein